MANPRDKKQDSMLLSGLPPELAEEIKRTDYKQGDVIFEEGDPGDKLYVVAYGEVRIEKKLDQKSGKMKTLAVCFEEDFFGEMAVLEREKRFARAVAQTDAGLLELSADAFARLSKLKPEATVRFFLKLSRGISGKLRDTSGQLLVLYTMGRLLLEKYRGEKEFLAKLAAELNEGLGEGWSCSAYHYNVFNEELDTAFGGQPPDGLAGEKEDRWLSENVFAAVLNGEKRPAGYLLFYKKDGALSARERATRALSFSTIGYQAASMLGNIRHEVEEGLRKKLQNSREGNI